MFFRNALRAMSALVLAGCASSGPDDVAVRNVDDICAIYRDNPHWAKATQVASARWAAPEEVKMAIIWRESAFVHDARPPYRTFLGFPTGERLSSAYGYSQAIDGTWNWYRKETGQNGAERDRFLDAIDFVGWYIDKTRDMTGVPSHDAYRQYLAYHEGQNGYMRGSWRRKSFVQRAAADVARQAALYREQRARCPG